MSKTEIRGVNFDCVTLEEAREIAESFVKNDRQGAVFTPNAEIAQRCVEDKSFCDLINSADLIVPDGAGVVLAAKILKKPLKGKVAGVELAEALMANAEKSGLSFFFYGSKPTTDKGTSVAELAAKNLKEKYPFLDVRGTSHGYVKGEEAQNALIKAINASGADCLFVCLGAPAQEKWIAENRSRLTPRLILGLGGSLDVFAGTAERAPAFFVKHNLEWFYRLLKEPRRLGRMMKLPKYIIGTVFCRRG